MPASLFQTALAGFGALSATTLLCAGLAGLAVFLALRDPARELRRLTRRRSKLAEGAAPLTRLIAGRAGAPPLRRRVLLSAACALALSLAGAGIDGWLGRVIWFAAPIVAATGLLVLGWVEPPSARRRRQQLIMEVPQALELMAACLGAPGHPKRAARAPEPTPSPNRSDRCRLRQPSPRSCTSSTRIPPTG